MSRPRYTGRVPAGTPSATPVRGKCRVNLALRTPTALGDVQPPRRPRRHARCPVPSLRHILVSVSLLALALGFLGLSRMGTKSSSGEGAAQVDALAEEAEGHLQRARRLDCEAETARRHAAELRAAG